MFPAVKILPLTRYGCCLCRRETRPPAKRRAISKPAVDDTDVAAADISTKQAHPDMRSANMADDKGAVKAVAYVKGAINGVAHDKGAVGEADGSGAACHVTEGHSPDGKDLSAAQPAAAEKPKRKYVKSGKFVGKYNSQKQKQGRADGAERNGHNGETMYWYMHFVPATSQILWMNLGSIQLKPQAACKL